MATASVSAQSARAKPDIMADMQNFTMNGMHPLRMDPLDFASHLLRIVHAWGNVACEGYDVSTTNAGHQTWGLETVTNETLSGAMDGIATCAALADFMIEIERRRQVAA